MNTEPLEAVFDRRVAAARAAVKRNDLRAARLHMVQAEADLVREAEARFGLDPAVGIAHVWLSHPGSKRHAFLRAGDEVGAVAICGQLRRGPKVVPSDRARCERCERKLFLR